MTTTTTVPDGQDSGAAARGACGRVLLQQHKALSSLCVSVSLLPDEDDESRGARRRFPHFSSSLSRPRSSIPSSLRPLSSPTMPLFVVVCRRLLPIVAFFFSSSFVVDLFIISSSFFSDLVVFVLVCRRICLLFVLIS